MKDRRFIFIAFIISTLLGILTVFAAAEAPPNLSARSSALYEHKTRSFLAGKDMNKRLPMASTTKIMTALVAIESCNLDETIVIPKEAVGIEGSSVYLKENDCITVRDLLYSVMLQSANDAATALALKIGGDLRGFADMMNDKARQLGLTDTNFENPHGLDSENHYTTARDLAVLTGYALENETFKEICSTYKHSFLISDSLRTVVNHNKLLKRYDGAIGVKTGYTKKCGRCLVSAAERDGVTLIAVTLDAPDDWRDHESMLNYGFSAVHTTEISSITDTEFEIEVKGGKTDVIKASVPSEQLFPIRLASQDVELSADVNLFDIKAPAKLGDKVGEIYIKIEDRTIKTLDILADESVERVKAKKRFLWW